MNTLDKWKSKIKQVNLKQFNPMNKKEDINSVTDPDN